MLYRQMKPFYKDRHSRFFAMSAIVGGFASLLFALLVASDVRLGVAKTRLVLRLCTVFALCRRLYRGAYRHSALTQVGKAQPV